MKFPRPLVVAVLMFALVATPVPAPAALSGPCYHRAPSTSATMQAAGRKMASIATVSGTEVASQPRTSAAAAAAAAAAADAPRPAEATVGRSQGTSSAGERQSAAQPDGPQTDDRPNDSRRAFSRQPLSRMQIVAKKRRLSTRLPARMQTDPEREPIATGYVADFNHRASGTMARRLYLNDGDILTIAIHETCASQFSYNVQGVREEQPEQLTAATIEQKGYGYPRLTTKTMGIVHNADYGGYYVHVTDTSPSAACRNSDESAIGLGNATFIIHTPKRVWTASVSGAFTINGLTNPIFFATADGNVAVDADNRDIAKPGVATFVHMYNERWNWSTRFAPMFGLGITDDNQTEYYFGGGVRLGDQATINTGVVFGPVSRLPAGTKSLADNQLLTDLPTRIVARWFFGISVSIINVGIGQLQGPFAGASGDN